MASEALRVRLENGLKQLFDEVLEQKKITQQAGVSAIVAWFCDQDELLKSHILGQLKLADQGQIADLIMARLRSAAESAEPPGGGAASKTEAKDGAGKQDAIKRRRTG